MPGAQTSVAKARTDHLFADCAACDCGIADRVCVKQYFPADCSIHCQSVVDDLEVRQPETAIVCAVHQQTWQSIRCLCLVEPALLVGWPSHSQWLDPHPVPEVASRCLSPFQGSRQMVSPVALPEAHSALAADSACALGNMVLDDSADPWFLTAME